MRSEARKKTDARGNKKKCDQLGMSHGAAANRLRKLILFKLIQETSKDVCFQCGKKIESAEELSIEHKIPWLDSKDPPALFFDLDNIAFSHLKCNCAAGRATQGVKAQTSHGKHMYDYWGCRCEICRAGKATANRDRRSRNKSRRSSIRQSN